MEDVDADALCLALTRPATKFGVPYTALILEMVTIPSVILWCDELRLAWATLPIHGTLVLVNRYRPRAFDVARAWCHVTLAAPASLFASVWSVGPHDSRQRYDRGDRA